MTKKERLNKLLMEGYGFQNRGLTSSDNKFIAWKNSLLRFVEQYYGKNSTILMQLKDIHFHPMIYIETDDNELQDYFNDGMNEILEDLKRLIDEIDDLEEYKTNEKENNNSPSINVHVDASNNNINKITNNNTISIKSFEEVSDIIKSNTFLDNSAKKELLEKLDEIIQLEKSKDDKSKKWEKGKKILGFILDKGADIAIMYMPLIIRAISN